RNASDTSKASSCRS
ncbi:unnamed protein product, partial [Allacma fusca]